MHVHGHYQLCYNVLGGEILKAICLQVPGQTSQIGRTKMKIQPHVARIAPDSTRSGLETGLVYIQQATRIHRRDGASITQALPVRVYAPVLLLSNQTTITSHTGCFNKATLELCHANQLTRHTSTTTHCH